MARLFKSSAAILVVGVAASLIACGDQTQAKGGLIGPQMPLAPELAVEPTPFAEPSSPVMVLLDATGSVDGHRSGYGVLHVHASIDLFDVSLQITNTSGVRVAEIVGHEWVQRGSGAAIQIPEVRSHEPVAVVVGFTSTAELGRFETEVQWVDGVNTVRAEPTEHAVGLRTHNAETYLRVRQTYSERALDEAMTLRDAKKFAEALEWVEEARTTNIEVGHTLRLSGKLAPIQRELTMLRDELQQAMKPKPVRRVKQPKPFEIEVM